MTIYYVDDGGSATDPYDTWAKAATSLSALDDAKTLASGDIVYIGHDHVCQFTHSATRAFTGPATGLPCYIISATQGSSPPAYQKSTTDQIDTTEGAYGIDLNGNFAIYGIRFKSGGNIRNEKRLYAYECTFAVAANAYFNPSISTDGSSHVTLNSCTIDLTADGTTNRANGCLLTLNPGSCTVRNLIVVNGGYRTDYVFVMAGGHHLQVSASDLSGFSSASVPEMTRGNYNSICQLTNCLMPATVDFGIGDGIHSSRHFYTNCSSADAPTYLVGGDGYGWIVSSASIYRTGGATVEGDACSWLITTTANCAEGAPFYTPYLYGTVSSTGSKTFDLYITNDTADLTDAECWLEVQYLSTSDEAIWALATDQRTTITTTAAAQTDDTTSTWNGTGPSFTYKQKLSVSATVNETGQFRARVAVGKASIASSAYFYVDPKVTVS